MLKALYNWYWKPARIYEFWLPQSGPVGGLILALIICIIMAVFNAAKADEIKPLNYYIDDKGRTMQVITGRPIECWGLWDVNKENAPLEYASEVRIGKWNLLMVVKCKE